MQESLSSCEAILKLQEQEQEPGGGGGEDRTETLKELTETIMAMIECSNRAKNRHSLSLEKKNFPWPVMDSERVKEKEKEAKKQKSLKDQISIGDSRGDEEERLDAEFQAENNYENYVNYFKSKGILFPRSMWTNLREEEQAEKQQKQRENKQRIGLKLPLNMEELLVGGRRLFLSAEDCEYDSERGKFNCVTGAGAGGGGGEAVIEEERKHFNANNMLGSEPKLLNKKIEYFENKLKPSKEDNRLKEEAQRCEAEEKGVAKEKRFSEEEQKNKKLINILCLGGFFMTAFLLYLFPLPN